MQLPDGICNTRRPDWQRGGPGRFANHRRFHGWSTSMKWARGPGCFARARARTAGSGARACCVDQHQLRPRPRPASRGTGLRTWPRPP